MKIFKMFPCVGECKLGQCGGYRKQSTTMEDGGCGPRSKQRSHLPGLSVLHALSVFLSLSLSLTVQCQIFPDC